MHRRTADDQTRLSGTTRSKPAGPRSLIGHARPADLVSAAGPPAPNRLWAAGLTSTWAGFAYVAFVTGIPLALGSWAGGSLSATSMVLDAIGKPSGPPRRRTR